MGMKTKNGIRRQLDNSTFRGMCDGRRIYRERRGVWHVQKVNRPGEAEFTGTLREIERALKTTICKML